MGRKVKIEFIGDQPALDDVAKARISLGQLPPEAAGVLRDANMLRVYPLPGVVHRDVDPEYFGTSRRYQFGPDKASYIQEVEAEDVDKIMGSSSGHQFRVLNDDGTPVHRLILPQPSIEFVSEITINAKVHNKLDARKALAW